MVEGRRQPALKGKAGRRRDHHERHHRELRRQARRRAEAPHIVDPGHQREDQRADQHRRVDHGGEAQRHGQRPGNQRRADHGDRQAAKLLRILTPLIKFRTTRDARKVTGDGMEAVAALAGPHKTVVQRQQLGTGHAVLAAKDALGDHLGDHRGDVLVLFGADPLIRPQTIDAMLAARRQSPSNAPSNVLAPAIVVLGFQSQDPGAYGRLITADDGSIDAIVEAKAATPEELGITLCNSGVMLIDGEIIWGLLDRVGDANAKGGLGHGPLEAQLGDVAGGGGWDVAAGEAGVAGSVVARGRYSAGNEGHVGDARAGSARSCERAR